MAFIIENGVLKKYIEEKGVTEVTIPNGVTTIGMEAFIYCEKLESITIPESVTSIGENAFFSCTSLKSITIPDKVRHIGDSAFYHCINLESITIPDSVTYIGHGAFSCCSNLTDIKIFGNITSINCHTFSDCINLKSITIPDGVTSIGNFAFSGCKSLKNIKIPDSITSIGDRAFSINLENIEIPDSITNIGKMAFSGFTKIVIYKGNVKIMFRLRGDWNCFQPEYVLNNFIVADINDHWLYFDDLKFYYKVPLAMFMIFAYPQESSFYFSYLKNNAEDAVRYLTDEENIESLYRFLDFGFVTENNIDSLISYAVEHTQNGGSAESQLVLTKYKSDNFGCHGADAMDKFML